MENEEVIGKVKQSDFNWRGGSVIAWDLDRFNPNSDINSQIDLLKEDLAQVCYGNAVVLDLGWYPEFRFEGGFVLNVIRSKDWDNPLLQLKTSDPRQLQQLLKQGIEFASS